MKITYIISMFTGTGIDPETEASILANKREGDVVQEAIYNTSATEVFVLNREFKRVKDGFIVIVPNGSTLSPNYRIIIEDYVKDENKVYLPMAELNRPSPNGPEFRGFLNSSLWKPQFGAEELGFLDEELSKRGIDLTLYYAVIPATIARKYKLDANIKHYYFFHYFNQLMASKEIVQGIQKVVGRLNYDYELPSVSKEEKIEYFKLAQTVVEANKEEKVSNG